MTFRVAILRRARDDHRRIANWIAERSMTGAAARIDAYEEALLRLADRADACPLAEEHAEFDLDLRQTTFKTRRGATYRIVFAIVGEEVRVLRLRGPGQNSLSTQDIDPSTE